MEVKLVQLAAAGPPREIFIEELPIVLGRGAEADIRLGDPWVSRCQCELAQTDCGLVARDMNSKHGTLVNGNTIVEKLLAPGDSLSMGLTTFRVEFEPAAAELSNSALTG